MFRISALVLILGFTATTSNASQKTFIVGGEEAAKGELPFMVSLQDSSGHFCGASLIKEDWVLTAAHCVYGGNPNQVLIGLHDRNKPGEAESFRPARVIRHPKYSSSTLDYDYALIRLDGKSKYEPVALNSGEINGPTNFTTAGWGLTEERGDDLPNVLRKVVVPHVDAAKCNKSYSGEITDRMVCAGLDQGGKDSCQGDSGGPLVENRGGKNYLVGVVSWGEGCARANKYGVYSKVTAVADWIDQNTK